MKKKFISTPIFYANGEPHLGHSYVSILADCISRFSRRFGESETFFVTGMDEHGQKILEAAKKKNLNPQEFVDEFAVLFKNLDEKLSVKYDRFIRTTEEEHKKVCAELWMKLFDAGDLYQKEYTGLYCVGCESFKTEKDLVNGLCPDHLVPPIILTDKNWFFKLSKYESFLKEKIQNDEIKITPTTRKNEILSFIDSGLQDISFSRSKNLMSWGIDVPNDDTQVMYVWADALTNYITAAKYLTDKDFFENFWQQSEKLHVIGKDILRFHALYWPAMLKSVGLELPNKILVHGLIKSEGMKMSKSLGNGKTPNEILEEYSFTNSSEVFRYFFLKNISPFDDGDYTVERMKDLYNADLANGLGNLVSRTLKLSEKYLEVKTEFPVINFKGDHKEFYVAMENYDTLTAMNYIWGKIAECDLFMQKEEPFKVVKVDLEKGISQLQFLRENIYTIAELLYPFMPETSEAIKQIVMENKMPEKPLFPRYE